MGEKWRRYRNFICRAGKSSPAPSAPRGRTRDYFSRNLRGRARPGSNEANLALSCDKRKQLIARSRSVPATGDGEEQRRQRPAFGKARPVSAGNFSLAVPTPPARRLGLSCELLDYAEYVPLLTVQPPLSLANVREDDVRNVPVVRSCEYRGQLPAGRSRTWVLSPLVGSRDYRRRLCPIDPMGIPL